MLLVRVWLHGVRLTRKRRVRVRGSGPADVKRGKVIVPTLGGGEVRRTLRRAVVETLHGTYIV